MSEHLGMLERQVRVGLEGRRWVRWGGGLRTRATNSRGPSGRAWGGSSNSSSSSSPSPGRGPMVFPLFSASVSTDCRHQVRKVS